MCTGRIANYRFHVLDHSCRQHGLQHGLYFVVFHGSGGYYAQIKLDDKLKTEWYLRESNRKSTRCRFNLFYALANIRNCIRNGRASMYTGLTRYFQTFFAYFPVLSAIVHKLFGIWHDGETGYINHVHNTHKGAGRKVKRTRRVFYFPDWIRVELYVWIVNQYLEKYQNCNFDQLHYLLKWN